MDTDPDRRVVLAAGGVVWRDGRVAVVCRRRYRDCSLPKGKLTEGESFESAARREVEEETGVRARISGILSATVRDVLESRKVVVFYQMHFEAAGTPVDDGEVEEVLWLLPEEALARLQYEDEREVLRRAAGKE